MTQDTITMDTDGIHKIYISGPITGMPELNKPVFDDAAQKLRAAGYEPVNPHDNGVSADAPWQAHMRADIKLLMDCDALVYLEGSEASAGAKIEIKLAFGLGMPAAPLSDVLRSRVRRVA